MQKLIFEKQEPQAKIENEYLNEILDEYKQDYIGTDPIVDL
jgi:hypothetical protein